VRCVGHEQQSTKKQPLPADGDRYSDARGIELGFLLPHHGAALLPTSLRDAIAA
jgi:hypothetical protein